MRIFSISISLRKKILLCVFLDNKDFFTFYMRANILPAPHPHVRESTIDSIYYVTNFSRVTHSVQRKCLESAPSIHRRWHISAHTCIYFANRTKYFNFSREIASLSCILFFSLCVRASFCVNERHTRRRKKITNRRRTHAESAGEFSARGR